MAATPPPGYTPPPADLPQRGDRATFSSRVDAWVTWFSTVILTQLAAIVANAYANAVEAFGFAMDAQTSATASASSATNAANAASAAAGIANAPAYTGTSTSSVAVGLGTKTFIVPAGKSWGPGMYLTVRADATHSVTGPVTSYSGTTLVLDAQAVEGSGTFASWAIGLAPVPRGLVLLAILTPTVAATLDALTVFNAQYDDYLVIGENVAPATEVTVAMYLAVAGTPVTSAAYAISYTSTIGSTPSGYGSSGFSLTAGAVHPSGAGLNFEVRIKNVNSTGLKTAVIESVFDTTATTSQFDMRGVAYKGGVVTGFRMFNGGAANFKAQGSVRVYGIQKL